MAKKIGKGCYEYKGYRIMNCGHYMSDYKTWWVAVKKGSSKVSYFANSKKELIQAIDQNY